MTWITKLQTMLQKPERIVVGAISGTSMDAIKVAICRIRGAGISGPNRAEAELINLGTVPYSKDTKTALYRSLDFHTQEIAEWNVKIGEIFADAILQTINEAKLKKNDVDLIGSHGQTLYHHSSRKNVIKVSFQIGDGDVIAERTGLPVVFDFRSRDIAVGGEGAPLTPYSDLVLYRAKPGIRRVILNLGGVANVTLLDDDPSKVIGFDTGPANGPLDRLARVISKGDVAFDIDSKIANRGKVNQTLLSELLNNDAYLKTPPPKSTGFEMYGDEFIEKLIKIHGKADENLLATVTEFVAQSIGDAFKRYLPQPIDEVVIAGGGGLNPTLKERIAAAVAPAKLFMSDDLGVISMAREAMAFAIFANDALAGLPTNLPSVTGSKALRVLGKLAFSND